MSTTYKALADPSRRAILDLLASGERSATEVADAVGVSGPNASYHLDLLRQAGLVTARKDGRFVRYSLATTAIEEVASWMLSLVRAGEPERAAKPGSA